jgi:hypothetical protein
VVAKILKTSDQSLSQNAGWSEHAHKSGRTYYYHTK